MESHEHQCEFSLATILDHQRFPSLIPQAQASETQTRRSPRAWALVRSALLITSYGLRQARADWAWSLRSTAQRGNASFVEFPRPSFSRLSRDEDEIDIILSVTKGNCRSRNGKWSSTDRWKSLSGVYWRGGRLQCKGRMWYMKGKSMADAVRIYDINYLRSAARIVNGTGEENFPLPVNEERPSIVCHLCRSHRAATPCSRRRRRRHDQPQQPPPPHLSPQISPSLSHTGFRLCHRLLVMIISPVKSLYCHWWQLAAFWLCFLKLILINEQAAAYRDIYLHTHIYISDEPTSENSLTWNILCTTAKENSNHSF